MQGKNLLTNFYGMDMTTDKKRSLIKKWHTPIDAYADVKTTDGYVLRMFCIGFTKRSIMQVRKTSYAQASQVRAIRREIERSTNGIYPLTNVFIRKVKMLRAPKMDLNKLIELHGGSGGHDKGSKVDRDRDEDGDDGDDSDPEES